MHPRQLVVRTALGALLAALLLAAPAAAKTRSVESGGLVTLGQVRCAAPQACAVKAPKRVRAKLGKTTVAAKVLAPATIASRKAAAVRLRLGRGAQQALAGRSVAFAVTLELDGGDGWKTVVVKSRVRAPRSAGGGEGTTPGKGGPGPTTPKAAPLSAEPPVLARPATAVDVSAVEIAWHPRDSWVRYVSSGVGPGDGILFANGASGLTGTASPCPDRSSTSDAVLPYTAIFTPQASWYDAVSGTAGIYGQGSVSFRWATHTIDLTASDPEIEITGASSRAIFRFSGTGGTPYPNQRASLVSLDLSGQPTVSNGGKTFSYDLARGRLTSDGVNVFAGFYTPPSNDEFGCVSVKFTTP